MAADTVEAAMHEAGEDLGAQSRALSQLLAEALEQMQQLREHQAQAAAEAAAGSRDCRCAHEDAALAQACELHIAGTPE